MKRFASILLLLSAVLLAGNIPISDSQEDTLRVFASRHLDCYDAEYHLGLVANSAGAAAANTTKLNSAMAATYATGNFTFAKGTAGPVVLPIRFAAKEFFFAGTLTTPARNGGVHLIGVPCGPPDGSGTVTAGAFTRFTRTDSHATTGGGILHLLGCRTIIDGIQINGQPLAGDIQSGTGPLNQYGIVIAGDDSPPTGKHGFKNMAVTGCVDAFAFVATPNENHGDECVFDTIQIAGCKHVFTSNNGQAVWNTVRKMTVITTASFAPSAADPLVIFNLESGGLWDVTGLYLPPVDTTVIRVNNWSEGGHRIDIRGLHRDAGGTAGTQIFKLFEYAGSGDGSFKLWDIRITGSISDAADLTAETAVALRASLTYDPAELCDFIGTGGSTAPCTGVWLDITNLPIMVGGGALLNGFTDAGFDAGLGSSLGSGSGYTWEAQTGPWRRLVKPVTP